MLVDPDEIYDEDQLRQIVTAIETAADRTLNLEEREGLLQKVSQSASDYFWFQSLYSGPSRGQVRRLLQEIHRGAKTLSEAFAAIDDMTIDALRRRGGEVAARLRVLRDSGVSRDDGLTDLLGIVPALQDEAQQALDRLDTSFRPTLEEVGQSTFDDPPDLCGLTIPPIENFICEIATVFQQVSGTEPRCYWDQVGRRYSGNFLRFVEACFDPLEPGDHTALGSRVRTTLRARRQSGDAEQVDDVPESEQGAP